jgi:ribosome-interacting GTPase 1
MGIIEKIQEIEREIARTQKNKATEYHLGLLKAKLAKYRVSYGFFGLMIRKN